MTIGLKRGSDDGGDAALHEMKTWPEVNEWRRSTRRALLAQRMALPRLERENARFAIVEELRKRFDDLRSGCVGIYWPFKGEIDVRRAVGARCRTSLPVVVRRGEPLEFWSWRHGTELQPGVWNIPVPATREVVHPSILLVPLLGFDMDGYRLGYGGGYYDRTVAAMMPRPLLIGIGIEAGRIETICPQSHDIPMDAIVTEAGFKWIQAKRQPEKSPE
jgi:5-formyltetrahydrofolate cyclo-ligase